jgi:hypothetical protein
MEWLAFLLGGSLGQFFWGLGAAMQMAIQPGSHNIILVSSRPACHAAGYIIKIPSSGPKLLATFRNHLAQSGNRSADPRLAAMRF